MLAVEDWFDWFDAADVGNNLVAGAIGLIVGLAITYLIVERLLRQADERRWKSARESLISRLKSGTEVTVLVWAFTRDPSLLPPDLSFTAEDHQRLRESLRLEVTELEQKGLAIAGARPERYWVDVARALGSSDSYLERAANRADVALRNDPDLVHLILETEDAHNVLAAFRADETTFGQGKAAVPLPGAVLRAIRLHLEMSDALDEA